MVGAGKIIKIDDVSNYFPYLYQCKRNGSGVKVYSEETIFRKALLGIKPSASSENSGFILSTKNISISPIFLAGILPRGVQIK